MDDEETFEVEKHVHAINLQEAGDYVVKVRRFVICFTKVVRKAKTDIAREYRKHIHYMREMVLKIGYFGTIKHADEAAFKSIVDPTCTAWQRAMHGAKMGNAKDLQQIEDMRMRIQKSTEDRKIPSKEEMVDIAGEMENHTPEDRKQKKDLIKCYWTHTTRAQEEAAVMASILKLLADEVDEATCISWSAGRNMQEAVKEKERRQVL